MRVLVLEDSAPVRGRLLAMLGDLPGVEASGARNAEQMRELLAHYPAEAVLLDMHLEGASGLELIGEVRKRLPGATAIVLTNDASELHRRACLARGADHFFDKSRDFERAVAIVAELSVRAELPNV